MTDSPRTPGLVLKLALDGSAFVNGNLTPPEEVERRVRELVQQKGVLVYYREAATSAGSPEAEAVFKRIVALRPTILLGSKAPSEWGRLKWLEVEEAPARSRIFVARGQTFLIGLTPDGGSKPTVYTGGPLTSAAEDRILASLDLMVRTDRVLETPMQEPDRVFDPELQKRPSLHVRIAYESGRAWASYFPAEDVPENLRSFLTDVQAVGREIASAVERVRKTGTA